MTNPELENDLEEEYCEDCGDLLEDCSCEEDEDEDE